MACSSRNGDFGAVLCPKRSRRALWDTVLFDNKRMALVVVGPHNCCYGVVVGSLQNYKCAFVCQMSSSIVWRRCRQITPLLHTKATNVWGPHWLALLVFLERFPLGSPLVCWLWSVCAVALGLSFWFLFFLLFLFLSCFSLFLHRLRQVRVCAGVLRCIWSWVRRYSRTSRSLASL